MGSREGAVGGSGLSQDALRKARESLDHGKDALASQHIDELAASADALERTLRVFEGIIERAG